jgi:hypothetical protein
MEAARDALRELRSIQEQRIADERAALERARLAAEAVRADTERQRHQAERDEQLRREQAEHAHALARAEVEARVKAEHELAVITAQADARARVELELAARHAVELQPAPEIPRSRAVWVLAMALALAIVALGLAVHTAIDRGDALESRRGELVTANRRLDELGTRIASIEAKLRAADQITATKQHDLDAANAEIARLRAVPAAVVTPSRPHAPPRPQPTTTAHPQLVIPAACNKPGAAPLECMPAK